MSFTVTESIAAPPDVAFDRMADARNETEWNAAVSKSELKSAEPVGPGSRFVTVNRKKPYDATIVTYDRPNRLVFEVTGKQMDITGSFEFRPEGGATKFAGDFDMRPKGFLKFIFPAMKPIIRSDLKKQSQSFKKFCERGT